MWGYDIHYSVQATAELLHEGEKREKGELARINYCLLFLKFFSASLFFLFFFSFCASVFPIYRSITCLFHSSSTADRNNQTSSTCKN